MRKHRTHAIYQIMSKVNNKKYVGSAVDYEHRVDSHLSDLRLNRHKNRKLQNHVNKYGIDDLLFKILELIELPQNLIEREQYYIDTIKPKFNIQKIAASSLGVKRTEEFKRKSRLSKIGISHTKEHNINIGLGNKGKNSGHVMSEEQKQILRQLKEKKSLTEEHKKNIGLGNKDKKITEETRINMINAWKIRKLKNV